MAQTGLAIAAASWAVLMGISPILQIRRMLRERSSRDVSVGYFTILLIGFLLWIAYGAAARNPALVIPNSVALIVGRRSSWWRCGSAGRRAHAWKPHGSGPAAHGSRLAVGPSPVTVAYRHRKRNILRGKTGNSPQQR